MRRLILVVLLLAGATPSLPAQSSIFGARGLGLPGRNISAHAWGLAGANGLFDPESNQNPASIARLLTITAGFQIAPEWRNTEVPAGDGSTKKTQFPLFILASPVRGTLFGLGVSFGNYANRDFQLVSMHSETIRGAPVDVTDTLTSSGGMNDIRVAVSYLRGPKLDLGAAIHVLTGRNQMRQSRAFSDTTYLPSQQRGELSYAGFGVSLGAAYRPSAKLSLAASLRSDGKSSVELDSASAFDMDLPYTFAAGFQFQASPNLLTAAQASYRTWSGANSDLLEQGAPGAENTVEVSAGFEYASDPRAPWRLPIRLGVRYAELPFLLATGGTQPSEYGVSVGTGARFAGQRGGIDLALERNWRSADDGYRESSWLFTMGISVRPALQQ